MSERMVIVIEYEVITGEQVESRDYMQRALTGAMTQIREGADHLDPNHVKVVGVHVGVEDFVDRVLALFAKDASALNGAPSSPMETTEGEKGTELRPCDSVALTERERQGFKAAIAQRDATIDGMHRALERLNATIEELQQLGDRLRRKADLFSADLAERDATIERVRALLGDHDGALWAVRGVREADIRAALEGKS